MQRRHVQFFSSVRPQCFAKRNPCIKFIWFEFVHKEAGTNYYFQLRCCFKLSPPLPRKKPISAFSTSVCLLSYPNNVGPMHIHERTCSRFTSLQHVPQRVLTKIRLRISSTWLPITHLLFSTLASANIHKQRVCNANSSCGKK